MFAREIGQATVGPWGVLTRC